MNMLRSRSSMRSKRASPVPRSGLNCRAAGTFRTGNGKKKRWQRSLPLYATFSNSEREVEVEADTVFYEEAAGFAVITLIRRDKLNAFNEDLHAALAEALQRVEQDEAIRALLLTGAGRGFCAGQDLSDRRFPTGGEAPDLGDTIERLYNPLVRRIRAMPKPVVCAVNGVAAGAGANVALACDIVLAA